LKNYFLKHKGLLGKFTIFPRVFKKNIGLECHIYNWLVNNIQFFLGALETN